MPLQRTALEEFALLIGEAVNDDVTAWELRHEAAGRVVLRFMSRDGVEYVFEGWRAKE